MRFNYNPLSILLCILICSCSTDREEEPEAPDTAQPSAISFTTEVEFMTEAASGRSIDINSMYDVDMFKLYAPLWVKSYDKKYRFMYYEIENEDVSRGSDGEWTTSQPYYWPTGSRSLTFFAYAPTEIAEWEIPTHASAPDSVVFHYTAPTNPAEQHDILFASSDIPINYSTTPTKRVELKFAHILARVKVEFDSVYPEVASVTFRDIWGSSDFMPFKEEPYKWTTEDANNQNENSTRASYTVQFNEDGTLPESQHMNIIPQLTPGDATLEVAFRDGSTRTFKFGYKTFLSRAVTVVKVHLKKTIETPVVSSPHS